MDAEFLRDLFEGFRPVAVKSMFGGIGIYAEGLLFAIAFEEAIFLRVDEASIPDFERENSVPFVYPLAKNHVGRPSRHFWRLPERLYDDPDDLATWAERSLDIARRKKTAPRVRAKAKAAPKKPKRKAVDAKSSTRTKSRATRARRTTRKTKSRRAD